MKEISCDQGNGHFLQTHIKALGGLVYFTHGQKLAPCARS